MYKIGLFNDSFPPTIDGVANAVLNYANIIHEKYGEAVVVTPRYPNVVDNYPFLVYRYQSIKFIGEMPYRVGNPFSPTAVHDVYRLKLDLLHVHSPFASSVFANEVSLLHFKKIPTVLTYHTKFDIDIDRFVENRQFNAVARKFVLGNINNADEVWSVSQGAIASLRSLGYEGDVRVMPNGTDFARGRAGDEEIHEIDRMYRTEGAPLVFLYCGRVMWYKNLKIILDALKLLRDAGVRFKMFFVGDGPDRPAVEQYGHTLGLSDDLIFTGAITDREKVRTFFSRADLFLFPSTYDTSGLVVKEAAACGCPSALTAGSCASEGVEDGVSGLLCPREDAEAYGKMILDAIRIPGKLVELGREAEEKVYYSWEDSVDAAWKRYEIILEKFNSGK